MYAILISQERVLLELFYAEQRSVRQSDRSHPYQLDSLLDLLDRIDSAKKKVEAETGTYPLDLYRLRHMTDTLVVTVTERLARQGFFTDPDRLA